MNPLLSVHLITYNNEKHVDSTIRSILMQKTSFNYEIVIGDDCSLDRTPEILEKYAKEMPSIIRYKQNNKQLGILGNFKTTLDRCQGKYVFDIAGDDLLKDVYALQKMVDVLQKDSNISFVDSGYDELYENTNKIIPFKNKALLNCDKKDYINNLLLGEIIPIGLCFNKQQLYNWVNFKDYLEMNITIEDYPILVDLVMNSNFERINESLHTYRIHKNSYSHQQFFDKQLFDKNQMLKLVSFFSKKYSLDPNILINYKKEYYKGVLYLSGFYGKKTLGREMYKALEKPIDLHLIIYYFSSQFSILRKLIRPFRKF